MIRIVFCYPSRVIGGAELLFVRCARYLSCEKNYEVSYIDYSDGYGYSLIKDEERILYVPYKTKDKVKLDGGSIVITPLSYLPLVHNIFDNWSDLRFLFWSVNPYNLSGYINLYRNKLFTISNKYRKQIGTTLKYLSEKNVIKYMDYNNYYWNSKVFKFSVDKLNLLPIPVDDFTKQPVKNKDFKKDGLSFLWLGRLDIDKYYTVLSFINELDALSHNHNITLYIIGTGEKEPDLRQYCMNANIDVVFVGQMVGDELKQFIIDKVDIGLAMGTSALDIAKLSKPVIVQGLLDVSYKAGMLKDYVLLYEIQNYDVVSPGYYLHSHIHTFSELFDFVLKNYQLCAEECAEYVKQKYSISSAGRQLIDAVHTICNSDEEDIYSSVCKIESLLNEHCVDNSLFYRFIRRVLSLRA